MIKKILSAAVKVLVLSGLMISPATMADTIKLGAAVSLSGKYSTAGNHTQKGYDLGVKYVNGMGGVVVDGTRQCRAKTNEMGATLVGLDIVGVGEECLLVAVVVLQGNFDRNAVAFALQIDRVRVQDATTLVEEAHELLDPALEEILALFAGARVVDIDLQALG